MTGQHVDFSIFSFVVGLVVGCLGTLLASYRFFQTRSGCADVRAECARLHELADESFAEKLEDLRRSLEHLQAEVLCVKARLTLLILYADVPEDKRAEILRTDG